MSELIDRQALIKQLKDENIPFNADINEIINIQPIAFDVDNIVEKLEEKQCQANKDMQISESYEDVQAYGGKYLAFSEAINIVTQEINNGLE